MSTYTYFVAIYAGRTSDYLWYTVWLYDKKFFETKIKPTFINYPCLELIQINTRLSNYVVQRVMEIYIEDSNVQVYKNLPRYTENSMQAIEGLFKYIKSLTW